MRYDRVALDLKDDANSFRIVSPRIMLRARSFNDAMIFVQYSHYTYGDRVKLRPGQVPLETDPDVKVLKIQAQMIF